MLLEINWHNLVSEWREVSLLLSGLSMDVAGSVLSANQAPPLTLHAVAAAAKLL